MLDALDDGLWVCAKPHTMMGLHLGARMAVVRLRDGSLLLHSPVELDPRLRAEIDALGPVSHITCPNAYHHVYAKPWADAYPEAMLHGAPTLEKKRPDLRFDRTLSGAPHADWEGTLVPHAIDGCALHETVVLHPASRTLITVDLTENFDTSDHFATRAYLKMAGIHGRVGWSKPLRVLYRDKRAAARSIEGLLELDFERVILAHGAIIERDGPALVRQTFEGWLL
ncbi:MAG: DUF4336 domain-containing protein [Sandaracinaceae bacterium]|nr:DUF4336 domain-containing protein [Sandaracinaceae bacterium]